MIINKLDVDVALQLGSKLVARFSGDYQFCYRKYQT